MSIPICKCGNDKGARYLNFATKEWLCQSCFYKDVYAETPIDKNTHHDKPRNIKQPA